jgi:hypothetical protein
MKVTIFKHAEKFKFIFPLVLIGLVMLTPMMAWAADGDGTVDLDVNGEEAPNGVGTASTGNTLVFTYTAAAGGIGANANNGIEVTLPANWSAPSVTATDPGYVTATPSGGAVDVSVAGQVITVEVTTALPGNGTITVTYGDKSGGGSGATAPPNAVAATKITVASSDDDTAGFTELTDGSSPKITVGATDGAGTAELVVYDPDGAVATTSNAVGVASGSQGDGNVLQITYTIDDANNLGMADGIVTIDIPSGWSAPSVTNGDDGYVEVTGGTADSTGSVTNVTGRTVTVSGITGDDNETVVLRYGGGTGTGATAQATAGTATFTTRSQLNSGGTLTSIGTSPTAQVMGDGAGTMTVAPLTLTRTQTDAELDFTFEVTCTMGGGSEIAITVPSGWTAPVDANVTVSEVSGCNGAVLAEGDEQISGSIITIPLQNDEYLVPGDEVRIEYGLAAPNQVAVDSNTDESPAVFISRSKVDGSGTLAALISGYPKVKIDGSGTASIDKTSVSAGTSTTLQITYTATDTISNGRVDFIIPNGWSPPQGSDGTAGYTTVVSTGTIGTPNFNLQTVEVPVTNLTNTQTITVVYGKNGGSSGAIPPGTSPAIFKVKSDMSGTTTLTEILDNPSVRVDGSGTASIDPTEANAGSSGNTFTITYSASDQMDGGSLRVDIPSGWTPPTGNSSSAGYTYVESPTGGTLGTTQFSGQTITIPITTLAAGGQIQAVYGFGGGTTGAMVQGTQQDNVELTVKSKVSSTGTLSDLISSPTVDVLNAADGSGTVTVSPTAGTAGSTGNTLRFTYTSIGTMDGGEIAIDIPGAGGATEWSLPSATQGNDGYAKIIGSTTAQNVGPLAVAGQTITIPITEMGPNKTIVVDYGNKSGGGAGATANSTAGTDTFTVQSKGINALATLDNLPEVTLSNPIDGSGTATVTPTTAIANSTGNEMIFEFTPNGAMPNGSEITFDVPSGWSVPGTTAGTAGYTTATLTGGPGTIGSVGVSNRTITVPITATVNGESTIEVRYGSGGGANGATATGDIGTSVFTTKSKVGSGGTLEEIGQSPQVSVTGPDGSGTVPNPTTVPATITAGSTGNKLTFVYTAATTMNGGSVSLAIPQDWSPPQGSNNAAAGYTTVTSSGTIGTLSFSGQTVTIPITGLTNTETITAIYGDDVASPNGRAMAQGAAGTATFVVKSKASAGGTLTSIADNPEVTVENAADGSGTCIVSPTTAVSDSTGNTLTFTYTSVGTMDGGLLTIDIDNDWPTPQLDNPTGAGYTVASSTGTISNLSITGADEINVPIVSLEDGETITVTYGAGGGASGVTAPAAETSDFVVETSGDTGGTIAPIAASPVQVTVNDNQAPAIAHTPVPTSPVATDIPISAQVSDDGSVDSVTLLYRKGGNPFDTSISMGDPEDTTYEATIPASAVTNTGLSYRIMAVDNAGLSSSTARYNVDITGASVSLPGGTLPEYIDQTPSRLRMVSIPIDSGLNSAQLFGDAAAFDDQWLGWYYTGGQANNGYQDIDQTAIAHEPGIAAWIGTTLEENSLDVTGTPPSTTEPYAIHLNSGWTQFGCPYNFKRYWNEATIKVGLSDNIAAAVDINTASSTTAPYPWVENFIYWWTPGPDEPIDYNYSYASSDPTIPNQTVENESWRGPGDFEGEPTGSNWPGTLDPWGGAWIYAYVDCYLFVDPTTPGPGATPNPLGDEAAPAASLPYSWSVQLSAESVEYSDMYNFAGIVQDAEKEADKYDVREPMRIPGSTVQLSFTHDDWGIKSGDYMQDMVQPSDEMVWNLEAKADGGQPVVLNWNVSAVPEKYRTVLLIDKSTEARINLREVTSYSYTPSSADVRNFELIISTSMPEQYALVIKSKLLQNYPNPFNPETWIPFKLSKAAADVTIKIYNISGQLVRTLDVGQLKSGSYTTRERAAYWDGKNEFGERVASGVYLYSIKADSFSSTRKMVILK